MGLSSTCPICRKPTDTQAHADFPYFSERCRLIDLGNWASEKYVISEPAPEEPRQERSETDERRR